MLTVRNISKKFRWYEPGDSLKTAVVRRFRSAGARSEWFVLSDVSFSVESGERVAIIGRNGCGKSTLLKLIAGIYAPTTGTIERAPGRMLALIELGVGFYPDLTGRQNLRLNWALNGLPAAELAGAFDEIVEFSGVGDFLDTPLKYYSSGMAARLGFSLAIHAQPDLLIVDEVLAVGDAAFQRKCYDRLDTLCRGGMTLVLVTHNMGDVTRLCARGLVLADGTLAFDGPAEHAVGRYLTEVGRT